jgi:hypothetical protein
MKIDLARYVLIYLYGGIYVDMDAYVLRGLNYNKKISEMINIYEKEQIHFLGLSKIDLYLFEQIISGITYNNAIMMSTPKNPLLKRLIKYILKQC